MQGSAEENRDHEIGTAQVARELGVSVTTVYEYVASGELHPRNTLPKLKRRGRRKHSYRFSAAEVAALKARQRAR